MLTAEQLIAAQKDNVETVFGLTNKALEGVEKLVELNLQVAKAAIGAKHRDTFKLEDIQWHTSRSRCVDVKVDKAEGTVTMKANELGMGVVQADLPGHARSFYASFEVKAQRVFR